MAKPIITRTNLFIIRLCYILLHAYLYSRSKIQLTRLVCSACFTIFKKIVCNNSMFYCLTKWQLPKPLKVASHTNPAFSYLPQANARYPLWLGGLGQCELGVLLNKHTTATVASHSPVQTASRVVSCSKKQQQQQQFTLG